MALATRDMTHGAVSGFLKRFEILNDELKSRPIFKRERTSHNNPRTDFDENQNKVSKT